ncbi:hypothetical protein CANARDRAFT_177137 [[Candida] arabinofermentans NRRL YB-2248]|uniref:Uncharacterized protein n=1 Tax=[Candida] arabinofermentans NRRL YB-2248 TaxID=983967 RepID=A0A1E4SXP2_9ASCO|nr:hypothetical protein CANARDRAFT_177137 [[Candida] arabinofermentans NRRL YB-2248]
MQDKVTYKNFYAHIVHFKELTRLTILKLSINSVISASSSLCYWNYRSCFLIAARLVLPVEEERYTGQLIKNRQ